VKVLPTVSNPAVLELKGDAVANIQVLAVSLRAAALDADHAAVIICRSCGSAALRGLAAIRPVPTAQGMSTAT
jgi:hypothetical protein